MKSRFHIFVVLLAGGLCCASAFAGTDALPGSYPVERYAPLWKHSPFTIATVQPVAEPGFAQNLVVVATAGVDGGDMVTLLDKQSLERFTLDSTPNEQGMRVVSVVTDADPMKTHVTIQKGTEVATVGFDKAAIAAAQAPAPPANPRVVNGQMQFIINQGTVSANPPPGTVNRVVRRIPPVPVVNPAPPAPAVSTAPAPTQ